jgi:hypothetical protein
MPRSLTAAALLAMALYAADARADADDADPPAISFSGFGTLGLAHSSEDRADFISSGIRPKGAGFSHDWSAAVDSRIGAQIDATLTPKVSAVVQVISEQRYDNSYAPTVEWANIKYQFTPEFSVRAGRIVLPVFLVSDHRKVGYANPWVRPPVEVYSLVPISTSDGVDASFRMRVGELSSTLQGTYGASETKLQPGRGTAKAKDAWGIAYTAERGAATARVSYHRANLTMDSFKPLFDAFRQFGAEGIAIANKYDTQDKPISFVGLGGMYDPGRWFAILEWGATDNSSVLGRRTAWYASGGLRFGSVTPYFTFARTKAASNTSDPGLTLSALPPFLVAPAAGLNSALNDALGANPEQQTFSLGARWDFAKQFALKLQYDRTRLGAGSDGTLINTQPGFQPGGRFDVFSATLDFVF